MQRLSVILESYGLGAIYLRRGSEVRAFDRSPSWIPQIPLFFLSHFVFHSVADEEKRSDILLHLVFIIFIFCDS